MKRQRPARYSVLFALAWLSAGCSSTGLREMRSPKGSSVRPVHAQSHAQGQQAPLHSGTTEASFRPHGSGDVLASSFDATREGPLDEGLSHETQLPAIHHHAPVLSARSVPEARPWTGPNIPLDRLAFSPRAESPEEEDRWSSFLPFYGEKAREKGYDLPYPFGIGATVLYISRPTDVTSVRAGANGNPLQEISFLEFDAQADVSTLVGRFDTWILPVLNVYLMGGYIWNESTVSVLADLPGAPGTPVTFPGELEGPMFGGGATLAGGYKKFFSTLDVNFSRSQLGALSDFEALLGTIRLGYNTSAEGSALRFWTGATYWDTARTIEGTIPLSGVPGISSVSFAVDQEPDDPLTLLLGTSVTVSKSFWLLFELQGWENTRAVTAGAAFRF